MRWTERDVWNCAAALGLDPFPTEFHLVPAHVLYDIAARGIPGRYSHWGHGKAYFHQIVRHDHGLGRIYELVINANPSQAFLLDLNSDVVNLMVMTHVLGHTDFFKHNRAFQETDSDMPERAALRAERIRSYEQRYGPERVEQTLDQLLTVEFSVNGGGYDPSRLPCRDLLAFLVAEAPLEEWQRDIAAIVREDGLYFWPQIRTKTVNEGWASLWHGKLMHQMGLTDGEFMEFARINAGVVSAHPGALNPYWLGLNILKDIERRLGLEMLFTVRRLETDASLVRNYLTQALVEELGLVRYGAEGERWVVTEDDWEQVRDAIANDFACPLPVIEVADMDFEGKGALLLKHVSDGRSLKQHEALRVLEQLNRLWRRPVYLQTIWDSKSVIWFHDGQASGTRPL